MIDGYTLKHDKANGLWHLIREEDQAVLAVLDASVPKADREAEAASVAAADQHAASL